MFTKEHYIEIAKVLKATIDVMTNSEGMHIRSKTVQDFVSMLEKDNDKFDADEFLDAIYGKEEKI